MKPPLIVSDNGDVDLFESIEDLERYIESPDVSSLRAFDANGQVLCLMTRHPVPTPQKLLNIVFVDRVSVSESGVQEVAELEALLRNFLFRVTGQLFDSAALPDLLKVFRAKIGFQR
jgi:hypothetical protein